MEANVNEIVVSFGLEIPLDRTASSTKEVFVVMMVVILMLMMIILAMVMVMISKLLWISPPSQTRGSLHDLW